MDYKFLNSVNSPEDVKGLRSEDIPALCGELREFLIENTRYETMFYDVGDGISISEKV